MRVISGKARGVNLKTPTGMATRPTADRVKEAVFSILQFDLPNASVLDRSGPCIVEYNRSQGSGT